MANIRQSLLIRTDLHLPAGLLAAQACHIHFEWLRQQMLEASKGPNQNVFSWDSGTPFDQWINSPYLFIHGVPHYEALSPYKEKAVENKLPISVWTDTIYQELAPDLRVPFKMVVGLSIGPADSDAIKMVIGSLPLL